MAATAYRVEDQGRDRERWLKARKKGIGASEVGVVMGVSPWGSRMGLFADKTGHELPFTDSPVMAFGRDFEPFLLHHYAASRGRKVRSDGRLLRSRKYPWLTCTMDARQWTLGGNFIGGVEGKTTLDDWSRDGLPAHVDLQVQTQYLVTGWETIDIAVFNRFDATYGHLVIEPHEPTQQAILEQTSRFWDDHVLRNNPPEAEPSDDCRKAIEALYPKHEVGKIIQLGDEAVALTSRIAEEEATMKISKANLEWARNELRMLIGNAEYVELPDGSGFANRLEVRDPFLSKGWEGRVLRRVKSVAATIERREKETLRAQRKAAAAGTVKELQLVAGARS